MNAPAGIEAIKPSPEKLALARRLIWFEPPEHAQQNPIRLLAYAFAKGKPNDMALVNRLFTKSQLQYALGHAPPGIIDGRSWAYWHLMLDLKEAPQMSERRFAE